MERRTLVFATATIIVLGTFTLQTMLRGSPTASSSALAAGGPMASPAAAQASAASAQPNFTALKDDFVPGEKTLFYDDFTDMMPGEAPPHWKVRGQSLTLEAAGDVRQVTAAGESKMTPLLTGFPKNFTVETEFKLGPNGGSLEWDFYRKGSTDEAFYVQEKSMGEGELHLKASTSEGTLVDSNFSVDWSQPIKHAIWVQDGRVRIYNNGRKVLDVNQIELPPLATALLDTDSNPDHSQSIRVVRIAEATPDFSRSILSSGRYVTHGILFDTDSDRIKPESGPVIKSVAAGLQANPDLKLRIEGHTDSTGAAAHNLDLSKRRAEAVKAVLVSQFHVDAGRLTTEGLGATKPIDSNNTPQGRAQNRRVEFVRQ